MIIKTTTATLTSTTLGIITCSPQQILPEQSKGRMVEQSAFSENEQESY